MCDAFKCKVPHSFNLVDSLCDRWAERTPERVTLYEHRRSGAGSEYTYADLASNCCRFADELAERGVSSGDWIALTAPQTVEMLKTYLVTWRLGAISVPLVPQFCPDAIEYRIGDCGTRDCVVEPDNAETVKAAKGLPMTPGSGKIRRSELHDRECL